MKRKDSELASVVQESIASARLVKTFAREEFEGLDREGQKASLRSARSIGGLAPMVDVIVATALPVLWFGARLVLRGGLTAGAPRLSPVSREDVSR